MISCAFEMKTSAQSSAVCSGSAISIWATANIATTLDRSAMNCCKMPARKSRPSSLILGSVKPSLPLPAFWWRFPMQVAGSLKMVLCFHRSKSRGWTLKPSEPNDFPRS